MRRNSLTALFGSALLAVTVVACGGDEPESYQQPTDTPATGTSGAAGVSVGAIKENPNQFMGQTLTLESEVDRVVGPRAFYLDDDAPLRGGIDNDLLVLTRSTAGTQTAGGAEEQWGADERVRISGSVARVTVVELERELGWDFDPQLEAELERVEYVLLADSVQRMNR